MKVILTTGGRDYEDFATVNSTLAAEAPDLIIVGDARGADSLVTSWAISHKVPHTICPADWNKHGDAAGPIRNATMCEIADSLMRDGHSVKVIAFPGGKGTESCINQAKFFFLPICFVTKASS